MFKGISFDNWQYTVSTYWSIFFSLLAVTVLTWAIMGVASNTTHARDFEAACSEVGGVVLQVGTDYDHGCFKVTTEYEPLEVRPYRHWND